LQNELRTTQKQLETLKAALAKSEALLTAESVGDYKILFAQLEDVDPESLKTAAEDCCKTGQWCCAGISS